MVLDIWLVIKILDDYITSYYLFLRFFSILKCLITLVCILVTYPKDHSEYH